MSRPTGRHLRLSGTVILGILLACAGAAWLSSARAQSASQSSAAPPAPVASGATSPPASQAPAANAPEMTTHDNPVPLQSRVNLVPVRVVVRDSNGNAVANLHREDFQLFEDGKPQIVSNFTVETLASLSANHAPAIAQTGDSAPTGTTPAFLPPSRFVALLFDDPHLNVQDLMQARIAAGNYVDKYLAPTDRVAVFTVSGQLQTDFTDDRAKLHEKLLSLLPRAVTAGDPSEAADCPIMDYYEAVEIQDHHDPDVTNVALQDAVACLSQMMPNSSPSPAVQAELLQQAQALVESTALRMEDMGDEQTGYALRRLKEVVQRMSVLPGQRSIVLISPGFIYPNREQEFSELIDRAIRENVFINTLDARGLYTPDLGDISKEVQDPNPVTAGYRTRLHLEGQATQVVVLMDLAAETGGLSFHDNNDLAAGLREIVAAPEVYYLLAFVPQNLKYDGHFHSVNVKLAEKNKYTIQARKGFYAPKHGETPEETAARDIQDALFSQEEQHGLPVGLQTQYYKTDASDAKLAVLAHVDLAHMRFDKAGDRNDNDLTVVAAVFDRNGNFITGTQKVIQMKLRDETLARLSQTGVTVRTNFDVKPGDYVVRLVVRDSNAAQLGAESGSVEIPY
ncbi:MAG TPA: VWA domain-containing protein [Candidatus Baltobacteraceae bacterium]|nr:VWA domain-containing protein [Candidatus Baltobacteraceae bacterium]